MPLGIMLGSLLSSRAAVEEHFAAIKLQPEKEVAELERFTPKLNRGPKSIPKAGKGAETAPSTNRDLRTNMSEGKTGDPVGGAETKRYDIVEARPVP